MKQSLFELMGHWADDTVELSDPGDVSLDAVREKVLAQTKRKRRSPVLILLTAALVAALLTTAVFAAVQFSMRSQTFDRYKGSMQWMENGELKTIGPFDITDRHFMLVLDCKSSSPYDVKFQASYLPEELRDIEVDGFRHAYNEQGELYAYEDEEKYWYSTLSNVRGGDILYQVQACSSRIGCHRLIYGGEVTVHSEQTVGDWYVVEFTSDCKNDPMLSGHYGDDDIVNFIVAFDTKRGLELHIAGLLGLDELEKIADGLTLRVTESERTVDADEEVYLDSCSFPFLALG